MAAPRENSVPVLESWKCPDLAVNKLLLTICIRDMGIVEDRFVDLVSVESQESWFKGYKKGFTDYDFLKKKK